MFKNLFALAIAALVLVVLAFPATWLIMLGLGNVAVNVSFWGSLPFGILMSLLLGASAGERNYFITAERR